MRNKWFKLFFPSEKRWLLGLVLICLVVATALGSLLPRLIKDLFASYSDIEEFKRMGLILLALFCWEYVNRIVYQIGISRYVQIVLHQVRSFCFEQWIRSYELPGRSKRDNYPLGEVLARLMNDTDSVRELISSGSFGIIIDLCFIISCLISFLTLNFRSGIFLLIVEVMICGVLVYGSKYMARIFFRVRKAHGILARTVADVTAGMSQMYYNPHEQYASRKSLTSFQNFLQKQLRANVWDASYYSVAESLFPILLALVVVVIPYSEIVEVAVIAAIIDLVQRSISPIKDVAGKISNIQRAAAGMQRITEFAEDLQLAGLSPLESLPKPFPMQAFSFRLKSFSYPLETQQERVFKLGGLELQAKKGQLIGLVGLSGSGKSTLMKILSLNLFAEEMNLSLYSENEELSYCSSDPSSHASMRGQISLISQDSHIFGQSLKFNITLDQPSERDFESFWNFCLQQIPYLERWGIRPEDRLQVSEISLGQRQLISAIRACYLRRPLVLFDEISSSLDSEVESALREMILLIQANALTFLVTHRVESILLADKIVLLDQGQLVAMGKHAELLSTQPLYRQFVAEIEKSAN